MVCHLEGDKKLVFLISRITNGVPTASQKSLRYKVAVENVVRSVELGMSMRKGRSAREKVLLRVPGVISQLRNQRCASG